MKALTLTQPWASLVALGAKRIETRSWKTNYRGPLAIHAAKGYPDTARALCYQEPFNSALTSKPDILFVLPESNPDELPTGVIVATCELVDVHQITEEATGWMDAFLRIVVHREERLIDDERSFGDFTPGRYAWLLSAVEPLKEPISARGALGLWEWEGAETIRA